MSEQNGALGAKHPPKHKQFLLTDYYNIPGKQWFVIELLARLGRMCSEIVLNTFFSEKL